MRKINAVQIITFFALILPAIALSVITARWVATVLPQGELRGVLIFLAWLVLLYVYVLLAYRFFLAFFPLRDGPVDKGSREEFIYHVYLLFQLLFFQSLTRSLLVPVPLMRLVYLALGAKLGDNTYSGGTILDPPLTRIGSNTIIGHDAVLFSHVMEGDHLELATIEIGNGVTIGGKAVIMPGVKIGDHAIIAINAVVTKGTHVGPGECWAGMPARRLRAADFADSPESVRIRNSQGDSVDETP